MHLRSSFMWNVTDLKVLHFASAGIMLEQVFGHNMFKMEVKPVSMFYRTLQ